MEYEIDDDPQGLPDMPEGDRNGGLRETLVFRKSTTHRSLPQLDEDTPGAQHGELV